MKRIGNECSIHNKSAAFLYLWASVLALVLGFCGPARAHCDLDSPASTGEAPRGVLDGHDCDVVWGWTCDPDDFDAALDVEIREGSQVLATVTADRRRNDLNPTGFPCGGTQRHGFRWTIPNSLKDGNAHSLEAHARNSNGIGTSSLDNNPISLTCEPPAPPNNLPKGSNDGVVRDNTAFGWACDPDDWAAQLDIEIHVDGSYVDTIRANGGREGAVGQSCGNGHSNHGYEWPLPSWACDGQNRTVSAFALDSSGEGKKALDNNPRTFNCGTPGGDYDPKGNHDWHNCEVSFGWACDRDDYSAPLQVEIRRGSTTLGTVTANASRGDVAGACGGFAQHGFEFDIPEHLKNGSFQTLDAYARHSDGTGAHHLGSVKFNCGCTYPDCYTSYALEFVPLTSCRLYDSRQSGGVLRKGIPREVVAAPGPCGIPADAVAVSANVTYVAPTHNSKLAVFPGDAPGPSGDLIRAKKDETRANHGILKMPADGSRVLKFQIRGGLSSTEGHVVVDVTGYYR